MTQDNPASDEPTHKLTSDLVEQLVKLSEHDFIYVLVAATRCRESLSKDEGDDKATRHLV